MTTNLARKKREKLLEEVAAIQRYIAAAPQGENRAKLLAYIADVEKELRGKNYGLVFEEHEEEIDGVLETHFPVFCEEESLFLNNGGALNFLIEGDNLAALQALEKTHAEKVDFIYIDPPYNTGRESALYSDRYVCADDGFRHSVWSSFMAKRLRLAHRLLAKDGAIFISIDENEYASLKLLCDDIFGERNLLSVHHIQVRYANKNLNERKDFQEVCEYVLIYAKNVGSFHANKPYEEYDVNKFCYRITETGACEEAVIGGRNVKIFKQGNYRIEKQKEGGRDLLKATWASGSVVKGNASGKYFETHLKPRKELDGLGTLYKVEGIGEDGLGYRYFTGPMREGATQGQFYSGIPLTRLQEMENGAARKYRPIHNFYDFSADFGNIRHEGGVPFNGGKKPTKMIKQFLNYHPRKDILVLDFFAGSASTGQAVIDLNEEDGGSRRFILCTSNEQNICREVAYPRLRNVLEKKKGCSLKYYKVEYLPLANQEEQSEETATHACALAEMQSGRLQGGEEN